MTENLSNQSTARVQLAPFVYLGFLAACLLGMVWGCVDQRPDPRNATQRNLNQREWKQVRGHFLTKAPTPRYPLRTTLSIRQGSSTVPAVYIYGVDVNPSTVSRGKSVTVTYYFKPLRKFSHNWGLFLHIEAGPKQRYYMNKDHHPVNGLYPSSRWTPNRIFKSSVSFTLPRDFPGQKLYLYSGFWRGNGRMVVPSSAPSDGKNRLLLAKVNVLGKGLSKPIYVAYQIDKAPTIDGKLDEPIWKKLPSTGRWGTYNNRKAHFTTWARMAWDKKYLYLGVYCEDDDIWSTYKKRDDPIFKQEVVEFFIDANRNHRDYVELQVSPAGVIFDSFFPRYRWPRPMGRLNFNSGMLVKIGLNGTLNNKRDKDKSYTVEMRLPLAKLGPAPNMPPKNGDEWLINFYRFERSRRSRGEAQAWSPVTLSSRGGDFHQIRRFGTLRFSTQVLRVGATPAKTTPSVAIPVIRLKPATRPKVRRSKLKLDPKVYHPRIVPYKLVPRIVYPSIKYKAVQRKPNRKKAHSHSHSHGHSHGHNHGHAPAPASKPSPRKPTKR